MIIIIIIFLSFFSLLFLPTTLTHTHYPRPTTLSYTHFTLVACDADGRARTVTWLPKVLGWLDYHIFLGMGPHSRVRGSARKEKYCDRFCIELQLH